MQRRNFKKIVIAHDMTQTEREVGLCRKLVPNAKAQEAKDKSGEYIYRVSRPSRQNESGENKNEAAVDSFVTTCTTTTTTI